MTAKSKSYLPYESSREIGVRLNEFTLHTYPDIVIFRGVLVKASCSLPTMCSARQRQSAVQPDVYAHAFFSTLATLRPKSHAHTGGRKLRPRVSSKRSKPDRQRPVASEGHTLNRKRSRKIGLQGRGPGYTELGVDPENFHLGSRLPRTSAQLLFRDEAW